MKASKSLEEVWEMKQDVYEETKDLNGAAYFRHLRNEANRLFPGIRHRVVRSRTATREVRVDCVAEERATYGEDVGS